MLNINKNNFDEIMNSGKPVVIDFWAKWCGPCKVMFPIFEKVSKEYNDDIIFAKLDIDEDSNADICAKLNIRAIPTIKIFKEKKEVARQVGILNSGQLKSLIDNI